MSAFWCLFQHPSLQLQRRQASDVLAVLQLPASQSASAPKKMSGPLERMAYPHIDNHDHQEAAWNAIVAVSGADLPG